MPPKDPPSAGSTKAGADAGAAKKASPFWTMVREHGGVFVVYWGASWVVCFVPIFGAIQMHIVPYDGMDLLHMLGADQAFDISQWSPALVNAVVAAEVNELLEFVRLPAIIATTPAVSRWLRRK